jgi:hypothetical protein
VLMTAFASLSTAFAARSLADLPVPVIDGLTKLKNALNGGGLQKSAEPLLYIFKEYGRNLNVEVRRPSLKKNGKLGLGKMFAIDNLRYDSQLTPEDEAIVNLWFSGMAYSYRYEGQLPSNADIASLIVKKIVETGRCHWRHPDNPALKPGLPLAGRLEWTEQPNGSQKLGLSISSDSNSRIVIAAPCLCYIDMSTWECGPVDAPCAPSVVQAAMLVPEIAPEEAEALPMWLAANAPQIPAPRTRHRLEKRVLAPKPRLWLETQSVKLPMPNGKVEVKPREQSTIPSKSFCRRGHTRHRDVRHIRRESHNTRTSATGISETVRSCCVWIEGQGRLSGWRWADRLVFSSAEPRKAPRGERMDDRDESDFPPAACGS